MVLAPNARAQEEPTAIVFAAYHRCNQAQESRADEIYAQVISPIMQTHQDAGRITAHGWARHWAGGAWRRLSYMVGTDMESLVEARDLYIEEVRANHADEVEEFNTICSSHDDYIWSSAATSQAPEEVAQERPAVGLSSYMMCDGREAQADAILKAAFAPIMDRHVAAGDISSWTWLEHRIGGWFRRALVFDAADYMSAINYWDKLWSDLDAEQPEMLREFGDICDSHVDYIWDLSANQ
jgi:hypothetical protein